jgi:hypothetical protein
MGANGDDIMVVFKDLSWLSYRLSKRFTSSFFMVYSFHDQNQQWHPEIRCSCEGFPQCSLQAETPQSKRRFIDRLKSANQSLVRRKGCATVQRYVQDYFDE